MTQPDDLQELIELLPFYVNGTLAADMRARIDAALPASPELQHALEQEKILLACVQAGADDLLAESATDVEARAAKVMKQANAPYADEPEQRAQGVAAALAFLNPRRWSPAVALTLAIAVPVQAAVIASQFSSIAQLEKENFELASGPCADRDRSHGIVLSLKDDARWQDVSALLDAEALVIVESAAFGVLTVRGETYGKERAATIKRLQQSPLVERAEPEA